MAEKDKQIIQALSSYEKLTSYQENHNVLLKDKTILLYTATLLDRDNETILSLCLKILENFVNNDQSHQILLSTFGIFEALESLSIRLRNSHEVVADRARGITDILRNVAPPAYGTRNRSKRTKPPKTTSVYLLHIEHLKQENRKVLEVAFGKIKGLISFVFDVDQKKCTVRIGPKATIKTIVTRMTAESGLKILMVTKNPYDQNESFVDLVTEHFTIPIYPESFGDENEPPQKSAVTEKSKLLEAANSWLKNFTDFWTNSLYW